MRARQVQEGSNFLNHGENDGLALGARFELTSRWCALAVAALGGAVLVGWWLDIAVLKSVLPGLVMMKANTALAFLLAGVSLAGAAAGRRNIQLVLAATVTLLGLLTLGEYFFAADFGIDNLLFDAPFEPVSMAPPGRMAKATAIAFAFSGLALVLLDGKSALAPQAAALVGSLIGILALLGYAFSVTALYGVGAYSAVALHTAVGFVMLNLGILLARPQRGLMAVVTSPTAGGLMARRLLPLALTAPFLIGWVHVQSVQRGLDRSEFGIALVALTYVVLFSAVIWRTARVLLQTDQRRSMSDRARRQQQAQLESVIDGAMDAVVMLDDAQRVVLFNPAAEQMFGRKAADVIGGPLDLLLPQRFRAWHAERVRDFGSKVAANRRLGSQGSMPGLRACGEEFPIEASISLLESNGEKYYMAMLRDCSESRRIQAALRESEARERGRFEELSKLLDAVPAAVWFAHDPGSAVITGNRLSYQWLGLPEGANVSQSAPPGERLGSFKILKNGEAIPPAEMPLQLAAAGCEVRDYEFDFVYPDGTCRHVVGNATPLLDEEGRSRGAISAFIDITQRREAELTMQAAQAAAERANNAKSRFLAAASHDLRQPLSALGIYGSLLERHVTAAGQPLLANLKDCIGSLGELLKDLLDLSKLDAGVVTPNRSDFSVADTLENLVSARAPEAHLKGLRLRCVPCRLTAYTDPVLFNRILGNLVDNAIRYTERGGVLIGCRRRRGKTWVEVRDSGIGIPEDKTVEIFEEFRQLDDGARTRGSGLGLAIVAKTAALLGVQISVRSRLGRGSVFAVELPLGQEQKIAAPEPRGAACKSMRIALVEDNAMLRDALTQALEAGGHRVVPAASLDELRARLGSQPPDVLLSDYRLAHGQTGFDVITAIRTTMGADLPAILFTGDTDPDLVRSMAHRGITVLHKPLSIETLQSYLNDLTYGEEAVAG